MTTVDLKPGVAEDESVALLLGMLDATSSKWRADLAELPDEALTWQAFPGGHSVGALLLHIADAEAFWLHEVAGGVERDPEELKTLLSEETDQFGVRWPAPPAESLGWYIRQQEAVRARTRQIVADLFPLTLEGVHHGRAFTLRWILHHVISHEAYHMGQAVLLGILWDKTQRR